MKTSTTKTHSKKKKMKHTINDNKQQHNKQEEDNETLQTNNNIQMNQSNRSKKIYTKRLLFWEKDNKINFTINKKFKTSSRSHMFHTQCQIQHFQIICHLKLQKNLFKTETGLEHILKSGTI